MPTFDLTPDELTAIQLSVKVALWAMLASLPPGILVAWLLARREFWGKSVINGLVHLPLVLPPVVTGWLLLLLFGRKGLIGTWLDQTLGIVFAFRWTGAALACAVMGFPLMVRAIRLSIEAIDPRLEQAAGTLGASRLFVFLTVTLPLALTAIYTLTQVPGGDAGAMRLTLIAVAISMAALLASEALARRTVARQREA
jgi:molybdate transport system permease protein